MALIISNDKILIKYSDDKYQELCPYLYAPRHIQYNSSDKILTELYDEIVTVYFCDEKIIPHIRFRIHCSGHTISLWSNYWFTLHVYEVYEEGCWVGYIEAISHRTKLSDRKKIDVTDFERHMFNETQVFISENVDYHVGFTINNKLYKIRFTETPSLGLVTLKYEIVDLTNINDFENHSLLHQTNIEFNGMYMSMCNCDVNKIQKHFSLKCVLYDSKIALLTEEGPIILKDNEKPYFDEDVSIPEPIRTKPARK